MIFLRIMEKYSSIKVILKEECSLANLCICVPCCARAETFESVLKGLNCCGPEPASSGHLGFVHAQKSQSNKQSLPRTSAWSPRVIHVRAFKRVAVYGKGICMCGRAL